jgi:hypothetical protein
MSITTAADIIKTIDELEAKQVAAAIIVIVLSELFRSRHAAQHIGESTVALCRSILHNKLVNDTDTLAFVRRTLAESLKESA